MQETRMPMLRSDSSCLQRRNEHRPASSHSNGGLVLAAVAEPHSGTEHPPPSQLWTITKEEEETRALLSVSGKFLFSPFQQLLIVSSGELKRSPVLPSVTPGEVMHLPAMRESLCAEKPSSTVQPHPSLCALHSKAVCSSGIAFLCLSVPQWECPCVLLQR